MTINLKENTTYVTRSGEKVYIAIQKYDRFSSNSGVEVGGARVPLWKQDGRFDSFLSESLNKTDHDIVAEFKNNEKITLELSQQECKILQSIFGSLSGSSEGPRGDIDKIYNKIENATGYNFETATEEKILDEDQDHLIGYDLCLKAGKNYSKG